MGCPELSSGKARPLRVIPHFGQVSEYSADRGSVPALALPGEEGGDVLHDDVARSKLANDSGELRPKTRAGAVDAGAASSGREVLAGEAAADEIDRAQVGGADIADVLEALCLGEVAGEDGSAEGVALDLPGDSHPASLEAKIEAADAGEERPDIHRSPRDSFARKRGS